MHSRLILFNQSTIEAYEKRPLQPWPYDQGFKNNFIDVFGRKKKLWLLPIVSEEHRRRLLAETLDVVAVPLPSVSTWQGDNADLNDTNTNTNNNDCAENHPADGCAAGGLNNRSAVAVNGEFRGAGSPSDESIGGDLGMVLIERANNS